MTILEAIGLIDELKPNTYSETVKRRWLNQLDKEIYQNIILTHEGSEEVVFEGYNADTDPETELLAEAPYDRMYPHFLEFQIDYYNSEYGKSNNSNAAFQSDYNEFQMWYNRTHMPLETKRLYFGGRVERSEEEPI